MGLQRMDVGCVTSEKGILLLGGWNKEACQREVMCFDWRKQTCSKVGQLATPDFFQVYGQHNYLGEGAVVITGHNAHHLIQEEQGGFTFSEVPACSAAED